MNSKVNMTFQVAVATVLAISHSQGQGEAAAENDFGYQIYVLRQQVHRQESRIQNLEHQLATIRALTTSGDTRKTAPATAPYPVVALKPDTTPTHPPQTAGAKTHTIRRGETLSKIARDYRVNMALLVEANHLTSPDHLRTGQQLIIPSSKTPEPRPVTTAYADPTTAPPQPTTSTALNHEIQGGETLFSIARKYRVDAREIQALNGIANPAQIWPGQIIRISGIPPTPKNSTGASTRTVAAKTPVVTPPKNRPTVTAGKHKHSVRPGDTLGSIARKYRIKLASLQELNGIVDANNIHIGQTLSLPTTAKVAKNISPKKTVTREKTIVKKTPKKEEKRPPVNNLGVSDYYGYTVEKGDTVESVAKFFDTSSKKLRQINDLPSGAQFRPGDEILIPSWQS